MKKIILSLVAIFAVSFGAQAQTEMGSKFVEINTGFGGEPVGTGLYFNASDGYTTFNIGAEGGYFVQDNLAIKAGLGVDTTKYEDEDASTSVAYKIGAKYFVQPNIPVELSYNGSSQKDYENPSFLTLQGGYAAWLTENISLEPGLGYNFTLNDDAADSGLQGNIGFAYYFN